MLIEKQESNYLNRIWKMNKVLIIGLLFECPFQEHDSSCQLGEIRKLPIEKTFTMMQSLSEIEIESIIIKHQFCIAIKEGKI